MTHSIGGSPRKTFFPATDALAGSLPVGLGFCIAAGVAAGISELYLHLPLHLPGWRGLFSMALLVLARRLSGLPWGASAAGFAAALTCLALGGVPRFGTLALLAPGLMIDACCLALTKKRPDAAGAAALLAFAAGLGNVVKFALGGALIVGSVGLAHRSGGGLLLPWMSHLGFGFCGGLLAVLVSPARQPSSPATGR